MIKIILAATLTLSTTGLSAMELNSFDGIQTHVSNGGKISVVIDDMLCKINDPNPYKITLATMVEQPKTVLMTDDVINFSGEHYASGHPDENAIPKSGMIQRASVYLNREGKADINISFYEGESQKKIPAFKDVGIQCALGEGMHVYTR